METGWPGSQGGTYGGNAVACAAALATLDIIEREGRVDNAGPCGSYLVDQLRRLESVHAKIDDVRGMA